VGLPLYLSSSQNQPVFNESAGLSRSEARQQFKTGLEHLSAGRAKAALEAFQLLEKSFPALLDVLLLHEAQAYQQQNEEPDLQRSLEHLLAQRPESPLQAQARYLLAQSYVRTQQYQQAARHLLTLRRQASETDWGIGALYYLGLLALAQQEGDVPPGTSLSLEHPEVYWFQYLKALPQGGGRFSQAIARELDALALEDLSPTHHALLGFAYGVEASEQALPHLTAAPLRLAWLRLGDVFWARGEKEKARAIWLEGLPLAEDLESAHEGIDRLLSSVAGSEQAAWLRNLNALELPYGGDRVLYQLAQFYPPVASQYYRSILERFPEGDYAPESSWYFIRRQLQAGNWASAKRLLETHLADYPNARSSPKAAFWLGRVAETTGETQAAQLAFEQTRQQYPLTYFAFRASQALEGTYSHRPLQAWATQPKQVQYPLQPPSAAWLALGQGLLPAKAQAVFEELKAIGAYSDALAYFQASLQPQKPDLQALSAQRLQQDKGQPLPAKTLQSQRQQVQRYTAEQALLSLTLHEEGQIAEGIRVLRDALDLQQQVDRLLGQPVTVPSLVQRLLLYPCPYGPLIQTEAQKRQLDPFLVQALMREESYFNPLALSSSQAMGLMQLLVPTAREVAGWNGLPFEPMALMLPQVNVQLGTHYLAYLHQRFEGNSMLAVGAYNGGPNAMQGWVDHRASLLPQNPDWFVEQIPYEQSRTYIEKVFASYWNYLSLTAELENTTWPKAGAPTATEATAEASEG
jgi:soluble lytic murein transglycosylase